MGISRGIRIASLGLVVHYIPLLLSGFTVVGIGKLLCNLANEKTLISPPSQLIDAASCDCKNSFSHFAQLGTPAPSCVSFSPPVISSQSWSRAAYNDMILVPTGHKE